MKTQIAIYLLFGLFLKDINTFAQDTTYLDTKTEYYSENGDNFDNFNKLKAFPKYSKEKIHLSRDSFKVERCYYFDGKRFTSDYIEYFKISNDSILNTENENWCFKQLNKNSYLVSKTDSCFLEKGTVSSIIPFVKNGDFINLNCENDTILIEHYEKGKYSYTTMPKILLKDSVHQIVDRQPVFPEKYGDLLTYISKRLTYPQIYAESSIQGTIFIRTVITSEGKVKNIEVLRSLDPIIDNVVLRIISRLPNFEPAQINGKNVSCTYIIPVKFMLY